MSSRIEFLLLDYLNFQDRGAGAVGELRTASESDWRRGLRMTDTAGLTLHLLAGLRSRGHFQWVPAPIRARLQENEKDHTARVAAMSREFVEFNRLLQSRGLQYLAIKGLANFPDFVDCLEHRVQYDHDFLVAPGDLECARQLFLELGYFPLETNHRLAIDHLPTLVKKTGWVWKGNLYDPAIPRAVELHFRLWHPEFDLIEIQIPGDIWSRSVHRDFGGERVPMLCREHALFYAALHAFRHLLRNDLRLSHLYELAYFLHTRAEDSHFWYNFRQMLDLDSKGCRMAATLFRLCEYCFGSRLAPEAQELIRLHQSPGIELWIQCFGRSESVDCFRKSKSALLLHLEFVNNPRARWKLVRQKWIPRHLPLPTFGTQVSAAQQGLAFSLQRKLRYALRMVERAASQISHLARFLIEFPLWQCRLYFRKKAS